MTGWDVEPGAWSMAVDGGPAATVAFERSTGLDVTFAPHATTTIELRLVSKGTPYWSRPDLAIGPDDVHIEGRKLSVKVHSLGSVAAPPSRVVVRDASGRELAHAAVPALEAPLDLRPRAATVTLTLPAASLKGGRVLVELRSRVPEITLSNNGVRF
jgi:hypothetical protein